jgi:hypothetical protein
LSDDLLAAGKRENPSFLFFLKNLRIDRTDYADEPVIALTAGRSVKAAVIWVSNLRRVIKR